MDIIYEIRRRHLVQKQTITEIARDMSLPDGIALMIEPIANCQSYDHLLGAANVH